MKRDEERGEGGGVGYEKKLGLKRRRWSWRERWRGNFYKNNLFQFIRKLHKVRNIMLKLNSKALIKIQTLFLNNSFNVIYKPFLWIKLKNGHKFNIYNISKNLKDK